MNGLGNSGWMSTHMASYAHSIPDIISLYACHVTAVWISSALAKEKFCVNSQKFCRLLPS